MFTIMQAEHLIHIEGGGQASSLSEWILEIFYPFLKNTHEARHSHLHFDYDDHCHIDRVWSG